MPRKRSPPTQSVPEVPVPEVPVLPEEKKESKLVMRVNFAAVTDTFTPREAGSVEGTLIGHEIKVSDRTGNPICTLKYSEDDSPNRMMFCVYSLLDKSLWSIKKDLVILGATPEQMNDDDADLDDVVLSLYGYKATLKFGDPRPGKDKDGKERLFDNFLGLADPTAS